MKWPESPRIVGKSPRIVGNGPHHLGLRVLQAFDSRLARRFAEEFDAKSMKQNDGISVFDQV